jgi:hypothetical protein
MSRRLLAVVLVLAPVVLVGMAVLGPPSPVASAAEVPGAALPLQEFVADHAGGRAWNAYDQTANLNGPTFIGDPSAISDDHDGLVHVFGRAADTELVQYVNDGGSSGQAWSMYDLTVQAGSTTGLGGAPDAVYDAAQGLLHVYAQSANGDLLEYVNDGLGGHPWNVYDLSVFAGGGASIVGEPSAVYDAGQDLIHVYVQSANNHLVEYLSDHAAGHVWNAYDLSVFAGGGGAVAGQPGALYHPAQDFIHVYVQGANGHLMEYVSDHAWGRVWNAYDLTGSAGAGSPVGGTPDPLYSSAQGLVHIFVRSWVGDMVEYVNDGAWGRQWNAYDLSTLAFNGGPVTGIASAVVDPATGLIDLFVRPSSYDLVEYLPDGANGHVWNAYDLTTMSVGPTVGSDPSAIAWHSVVHVYAGGPLAPGGPPKTGVGVYGFASWTAAGQAIGDGWPILGDTGGLGTTGAPYTAQLPSTPDLNVGEAIVAMRVRVTWLSFWTVSGPAGGDSWNSDGYQAGQTAAQAIDRDYETDATRPDWVILDPEGYNGTPGTLWDWGAWLGGWSAGITSVDSALHPAFYANQSQYYTYGLSAIGLPAFVAVSPIQGNEPFVPGGSFGRPGSNVTGYIAYFGSCPSLADENTVRGWGAPYNTLQFSDSGVDCGP